MGPTGSGTADVLYNVLWRHPGGDGGTVDTPIVTFEHVFTANGAAQYSNAEAAPEIPSSPGDRLVLQVEIAADSSPSAEFIPNGESTDTSSKRWMTLAIP